MSIFTTIVQLVQHNQFLQAALVAAPATALAYSAKALPMKIYQWFKKIITVEVRFNSDMSDFEAVTRFVTKNILYDKFSRNFTYQTERKWDEASEDNVTKHHGLTAGYGTHLGFYKRHLCLVERSLSESANTDKFKEHLEVTFFTRSKKIVREFAREIAIAAGTNLEEFISVPIMTNSNGWWQRMGKLPLRRMDTVFSANDAGNKLVAVIREFEGKKDDHHAKGLPHHLGILLHGEPGCGKSSLIHSVASELQRSIQYLNFGSIEKDKHLMELLAGPRDWSKVLLVIEDIDAAGVKINRDKASDDEAAPSEKGSDVTLSTLLNVLDGLLCPDGLVVIATTNHPDRLDPALRRPGRFDQNIELGRLGIVDFVRMCAMFDVNPDDYDLTGRLPMTGAEMRATIIDPTRLAA